MSQQPRSNMEWGTAVTALTAEVPASLTASGWSSGTEPSPYVMNWWQRLMHFWADTNQDGLDDMAGNPLQSMQYWGPGIDGDVSITGAVTLERDMFYENLTFEEGGSINVHGNRIFVRDTLDMSNAGYSAIWADPSDYNSSTYGVLGDSIDPGAAASAPSALTGTIGGAIGGAGGQGGGEVAASGAGTNNAGGVSRTASSYVFDSIEPGLSEFLRVRGGMGGSGGGNGGPSSAGGAGGRGGGGGGAVWISAQNLRRDLGKTAQASIRAVGEDGVDGADSIVTHKGGGGGGGGGAGGFVFIRTHALLGSGVINMIDVSGGNGGDVGDGLGNVYVPVAGGGGSAGAIYYWNVDAESFVAVTGGAGTAGDGAVPGIGAVLKGDL